MRQTFTAYLCGIVFGIGLGISQMTHPSKILGFLNVLGDWDPTLLVVFAAAAGVYGFGYHFLVWESIKEPLETYLRGKEKVDRRVVLGAMIFGLGWGLVGLCPGPALTDLASLKPMILLFLVAMTGGMYVARYV